MHLNVFLCYYFYRRDINSDPVFRSQFQSMCSAIGLYTPLICTHNVCVVVMKYQFPGVDPLASGKGFWAEMLGVGDFYFELTVQVSVEVKCKN